MSKPFRVEDLYRDGLRDGLRPHARRWRCLACLAQFRLPYEVTLRHVAPGEQALDWGCGDGHFAYFLTRAGLPTTGFSFQAPPPFLADEPAFAHVRGLPIEPVRLPFPDAGFDAVFSVGVLEHVFQIGGDERASMAEIRRILKPGGRFLCFHFPNRRGWIEPVAKATGQAPTLHLRKYGREDVEALTADGWRLLESGRYNMLPRNQLCRLPRAICDTEAGTRLIDFADRALSPLSAFAQNWYFVARKAED